MRRLFSTFARGLPGVGLVLLRLVAGVGLIVQVVMALRAAPSVGHATVDLISGVAGLLLLIGLWTPIAGALVGIIEFLTAYVFPSNPSDLRSYVLLGTLGLALALLGPGAYSIDARLFGWKRIDIPDRKS